MCAAERLPVVPGTRYVRHARGWYMYGVRTVLAPSPPAGASCSAPPVRTAQRRLVRVARTYSTGAPVRTFQQGGHPTGACKGWAGGHESSPGPCRTRHRRRRGQPWRGNPHTRAGQRGCRASRRLAACAPGARSRRASLAAPAPEPLSAQASQRTATSAPMDRCPRRLSRARLPLANDYRTHRGPPSQAPRPDLLETHEISSRLVALRPWRHSPAVPSWRHQLRHQGR